MIKSSPPKFVYAPATSSQRGTGDGYRGRSYSAVPISPGVHDFDACNTGLTGVPAIQHLGAIIFDVAL